jgi:actin-like ATPase involved in cell morphogenesis
MSLIGWLKDRPLCDLAIDLGTANTLGYLKGKGERIQRDMNAEN